MARKMEGRLLLSKSSLGYLFIVIFLQQLVFWGSQSFSCIHRTEQVYRFFQKWCPNIHNALDDDESEDDEMTDPHCCTAEEEVNRVISLFTVSFFRKIVEINCLPFCAAILVSNELRGWLSGLIAVGEGRPCPKLSPTPLIDLIIIPRLDIGVYSSVGRKVSSQTILSP